MDFFKLNLGPGIKEDINFKFDAGNGKDIAADKRVVGGNDFELTIRMILDSPVSNYCTIVAYFKLVACRRQLKINLLQNIDHELSRRHKWIIQVDNSSR